MVTLDRSQQSNAIPSGKKSVINTSLRFTSPVSAADTTAEAQLVSHFFCLKNISELCCIPSADHDMTHHINHINIFLLQSNDSLDVPITDERKFNVSCSQVDDASNSIISSAKPCDNRSSDHTPASKVQYVIKVSTSSSRRKKPPHDRSDEL